MINKLLVVTTILGAGLSVAQIGPPAPVYQTPSAASGTISQLNYGGELEINGFILNGTTLVSIPPPVREALSGSLVLGATVQVQGYASTLASGLQKIDLTSITAAGKTLTVPQPGVFAAYSGSGTLTQFNYGPQGEVNGFFLNNGAFFKAPPGSLSALGLAAGTTRSVGGYSRQPVSGATIVDVQTINGQVVSPAPPAGSPAGPGGTPQAPAPLIGVRR